MKLTLFTHYFNPNLSRKYGRKIPLEKAKEFTEDKLEQILHDLKASFDSKPASYPRTPFIEGKMYTVEANVKKGTLIKIIERRL